ncbi:hypothetical protein BGW37DRAFT_482276 [Umbelopsis sp. PMI_123]|nr:hypothetical protein BGW37DRAFT_482276 [Umbelopsis sp. PMI_123]
MNSTLVICLVTVAIVLFMAAAAAILVRLYRQQHSLSDKYDSFPKSCRPAGKRHWLSIPFTTTKIQEQQGDMYFNNFHALSEPRSLPPAYLSWSASTSSPTQHILEGYETSSITMEESMDPIQFSLAKQDEADRIWYHSDSSSIFHPNPAKRLSDPPGRSSFEYHVW